MARIYICPKTGLKRGAWTPEEDRLLAAYISRYGHWNWRELPKYAGLSRCGKSCRLRWMNYLRPTIKRGNYSQDEEELIIRTHKKLGNRWSAIAACLPGRTDNEIKNHWHTHLSKRTQQTIIANGERKSAVTRYETPKKRDQVENSVEAVAPAPFILESSMLLPLSPQDSNDNSLSCTDSGAAINENLLTDDSSLSQDSSVLSFAGSIASSSSQSFLAKDFYVPEYAYDMFSPPPVAETFHPYDMLDGYNIDISSYSNIILDSWL